MSVSNLYHVTAQKPTTVNGSITEETRKTKILFYEKAGFPGVIGVIDSTHVRLVLNVAPHRGGNFTDPNDLNLIIAKNTLLQVFRVTPEGLKPLKEIHIYGRVVVLQPLHNKNYEKDFLFVLTQKFDLMILELVRNGDDMIVHTHASGQITEPVIPHTSDTGVVAAVDPDCRVIGLRLFQNLFKMIELKNAWWNSDKRSGKEQDTLYAHTIKLEDQVIVDFTFLYGCRLPTVAILSELRTEYARCVRITEMEGKSEMGRHIYSKSNVDMETNILCSVPKPAPGLLMVGSNTITYRGHDGMEKTLASPVARPAPMTCITEVDHKRFLLGDMEGRLYMLMLEKRELESSQQHQVVAMKLDVLGETSVPDCISYLDNSVVFIGSCMGDSQLIKLVTDKDESGSYIRVMETFVNLGPIVDMICVDLESQGQTQLITCSGAYKDGSLRVIRSGIGIHEHANIDLEAIKGIWSLRQEEEEFDDMLVLSFVGMTRTLVLSGEEVEEVQLGGFILDAQTYHCANVAHRQILQVTGKCLRLMEAAGCKHLQDWSPDGETSVSVCNTNPSGQQVCIASGRDLYYLRVQPGCLEMMKKVRLEFEVACIDLTPLDADWMSESKLVAVGLWTDISVQLITLPDLTSIRQEKLGGDIIPRSILMTSYEGTAYLFVALGDGALQYYVINEDGTLGDKKRVVLGTQPLALRPFHMSSGAHAGLTNIFVCSDRPAVIYYSNHKLVIANVNLKEVNHMSPMHSKGYPNSLALASSSQLTFGSIDDIQKLHIRNMPFHECVRRLAHQKETRTIGVLTLRVDVRTEGTYQPARKCASVTARLNSRDESRISVGGQTTHASTGARRIQEGCATGAAANAAQGVANPNSDRTEMNEEAEVSSLVIVDQSTFEVLHAHSFYNSSSCTEMAVSILSCQLGDDHNFYYVVGTAYVEAGESEPDRGRIVLFRWHDGRLTKVCEKEVRGAPYQLRFFNKKLLACINSSVRIFEWRAANKDLHLEASHFNCVTAVSAKTKGDFILVGDLMRSLTLLVYKPLGSSIEEIARDMSPLWMSTCAIIDDDNFLGAENHNNLFVASKEVNDAAEDKDQLKHTGGFHIGDLVNVFKHGTLAMNVGGERIPGVLPDTILYGTAGGAIGVVAQLQPRFFDFLQRVMEALNNIIQGVGRITHNHWRDVVTDRLKERQRGFIDGDLLENFLDLRRQDMEKVVANLQIPVDFEDSTSKEQRPCQVEDLVKIVEDLARLH